MCRVRGETEHTQIELPSDWYRNIEAYSHQKFCSSGEQVHRQVTLRKPQCVKVVKIESGTNLQFVYNLPIDKMVKV